MEAQHTPDITTGFIQMVEAYKAKPELEAKIVELEAKLREAADHIGDLSNEVINTKSDLHALSADKERLTRERDDAMFRSLELEEKTKSVSDLVAKLESLVRPEPVAKVEAAPEPSVAHMDVEQRDVKSDDQHRGPVEDQYHNRDGSYPENKAQAYDGGFQGLSPSSGSNVESFPRPEYSGQGYTSPEGERGHPTSESSQDYGSGTSQNNAGSNAETSHSASMASSDVKDEPNRPNEGKPYHDKPWWVNDNDWRSQGGQGPHEGGSWQAPWERQA